MDEAVDNMMSAAEDVDNPINTIDAKLAEARAIADLLYTLASTDSTGVGMETLSGGTVAEAMHSIMARIDEARAAADSPRVQIVAS